VRSALIARGMSPRVRIRMVTAGETMPIVETEDGVADAQNRYAYIVLRGFASTSPVVQEAMRQLNQTKQTPAPPSRFPDRPGR